MLHRAFTKNVDQKQLFYVALKRYVVFVVLVAEPARPAEAGAGCLAGLTGLSGDILNGYKMISKMF